MEFWINIENLYFSKQIVPVTQVIVYVLSPLKGVLVTFFSLKIFISSIFPERTE